MANVVNDVDLRHYLDTVIPNIEAEFEVCDDDGELLRLYNLYVELLRLVAPIDFGSFNKYLELDEDHSDPNKSFYHHRKEHLSEMFDAFNDMEVEDKYDVLLIMLPPRTGKEQPLHSKILTPTGWSTMGDMKIGSRVIGQDGLPYNVTGVFPQGVKDIYAVTFDDGTVVECGLDHLWEVQTREDRLVGKSRVVTTNEMMTNLYVENDSRKNYSIDYVKPIEFDSELDEDDLDSYLLGALIGDGGLSEGVRFTNIDEDVLGRVRDSISEDETMVQVSDTITYNIRDRVQKRNKLGYPIPSNTLAKIREYGLDGGSHDKFIPNKYLYGSYQVRLDMLRGLMDTDGYCGNNSHNEYTTVSEKLSNDFMELVRSLGGRVTLSTKMGSYTKNDVRVKCSKVYRMSFNMEVNPFHCSRKKEAFTPRTTRKHKYISSIELIGKGECQCIMVDNPKHLYVTDGYNVTHNTTTGIRFLSWIIGKYPEGTQLTTSYSDNITTSFYNGVIEIVDSERYHEVFPESPVVGQNAKREEIWLRVKKRYPSIVFVPIGGSMTGRSESSHYLYCDDLVSGIEEALSPTRLDALWSKYTVNARQRKKDGAKEIHIATPWSVHDPISKLVDIHKENPRAKILKIPCYDEDGESQFNYKGGFSTAYYNDLENGMDESSFSALYKQEPIEREGILYNEDELKYYFDLPKERPEAIISVCDSKNLGKDNVSLPVAYVYGDFVYIADVVYNSGLPAVTKELVANKLMEHKVTRCDIEMNNGGNYFAEGVDEKVKEKGGRTTFRIFFSGNNKDVKIISYSDLVKKRFIFRDKSTYAPKSEYALFMTDVFRWTQTGKNKHDDAPDTLAMLAQLLEDMEGNSVKVLNRRVIGI